MHGKVAEHSMPQPQGGAAYHSWCPRGASPQVQETWVDELQAKYDVEVFEEMFCRRIADEPSLWYTEQPPGAVLTNIEEPERGLFPL